MIISKSKLQYLIPKKLLSKFMGLLAESKCPKLKNYMINTFLHAYPRINMQEAMEENPNAYASFNEFFIRQLKPVLRPIADQPNQIISPVDGILAEYGKIDNHRLIQAKNHDFDLQSLLAGDEAMASLFQNGEFATLYLAPYHYHRVHMPFTGVLKKTIYIPGDFFSVNQASIASIPNLYARNERVVSLFETRFGPMAVILVGAMIVGSMKTVWENMPYAGNAISASTPTHPLTLNKGDELGYFKMGSTVVLLFAENTVTWDSAMKNAADFKMGQKIAEMN